MPDPLTILVIEDDPIARMQMVKAIDAERDLSPVGAGTSSEAIALASESPPAVIVADAMLGDEDGLETVAQITAATQSHVIVVTALGVGSLGPALKRLQRVVVLSKPIEMDRLVAEIRDGIRRRSDAPPTVDSEFLLETLYDTARIGMCVTDEDRRFVRVNRAYCEHYGYPREELLGNEFVMIVPEADREYAARVHDEFIDGSIAEIPARWRVQKKTGEIRTVFVTAGRMMGTDGRQYKITTISDITDQIQHEADLARALEEKRILLREVHHRVRNNLNTLSALLDLQRQQHSDNSEFVSLLTVSINRVKTMSQIYERLNETDSDAQVRLDDYVGSLARDLVVTAGGSTATVATSIDPLTTDIDHGISTGLIVNELVTNAIKHASRGERACSITVTIHTARRGIVISVEDDGPGFPESFSLERSNSLGLQLVQAVAGQRDGSVEIVPGDHGHVRVELPGARFTQAR